MTDKVAQASDPTIGCNTVNDGKFVVSMPSIYPEYLTDLNVMICPSDPDSDALASGEFNVQGNVNQPIDPCRWYDSTDNRNSDVSYQYIGWSITQDTFVRPGYTGNERNPDGTQMWEDPANNTGIENGDLNDAINLAFEEAVDTGDPSILDQDIPWYDNNWGYGDGSVGGTLYRWKEGIERFFITDINNPAGAASGQSELPVMWDSSYVLYPEATYGIGDNDSPGVMEMNHVPGGANVLFLDGHVEFIKYPGEFPLVGVWMLRGF